MLISRLGIERMMPDVAARKLLLIAPCLACAEIGKVEVGKQVLKTISP